MQVSDSWLNRLTNEFSEQIKGDSQKLIPLQNKESEIAKEVMGTQWKHSQFYLKVVNEQEELMDKYLPLSWNEKETSVSMRARIRGANVARKIVLEFTIHHNSGPVHRAYLEFHASEHVTQYTHTDKIMREFRGKQHQEHKSDQIVERDGYRIIQFVTRGGIGIGLDFDANFLDTEDREVLWYARHLAKNFNTNTSKKRVVFRMNARWIEYDQQTIPVRRKFWHAQHRWNLQEEDRDPTA